MSTCHRCKSAGDPDDCYNCLILPFFNLSTDEIKKLCLQYIADNPKSPVWDLESLSDRFIDWTKH